MMAAFGFPSHMEDKNKNAPSAYPIRRQFTPTNVVRPAKTVFLDVRPPLENMLTEQEFLQTMKPIQAFENIYPDDVIYESMKPVINVMRFMGGFPFKQNSSGYFSFRFISSIMFYSIFIYLLILAYVVWVLMHRIDIKESRGDKKSGESTGGKFEEAVIAYLFFVYLLPIISIPILWFETSKVVSVFNDWRKFEDLYRLVVGKDVDLKIRQKSNAIAILLPILSIIMCVVIHATMIEFKILQVLPYCFLTITTYILGGFWYLICEIIGKIAICLSEEFHKALKNVGPAAYVSEYRALWLRLSNITRDAGISLCYSLTFLSLYLFLAITLSIYGLLSQIQEGFGIKDIGLGLTALSSIGLLFYLCDEAHYASQNVRVLFQKKLLSVELNWMNSDAQTEINMFIKATDLNPSNLSVGGFFNVNRSLFKSLIATMVTYLVVLLQFQISIPDGGITQENTTLLITSTTIPTL